MGSLIEESRQSRRQGFFGKYKKFILIGVGVIILGGGVYYYLNSKKSTQTVVTPKTAVAKKQDLQTAVQADGKVVAESGVDLSFSVSGNNLEVSNVYVKEGDNVKKGDKIATVKTDSLELSYRTAYANYESALADYNETIGGAKNDDIASAKDKISSAQISLDQAKISLDNTKQSADKSIYDAQQNLKTAEKNLNENPSVETSKDVRDAYNSLIDNIKAINISLEGILAYSDSIIGVDDQFINDDFEDFLGVKDVTSMNKAVGSYKSAQADREQLNKEVLVLNSSSSYYSIDQAARDASSALTSFESHLYAMKMMLDASVVATDLPQTKLDGFKSTIDSNRSSINSKVTSLRNAVTTVTNAKDNISDYADAYETAKLNLANAQADKDRNIKNAETNVQSRQLSLEQAQRDYDTLMAPLTTSEMASAKSKFISAQVNLSKAREDLDKSTIISPIDGVVSSLGYKAGDIIVDNSTSDPVATIVNPDTLFVEVNVEEADISKVKLGQKAYISFDALDGVKLDGEVSFISLTSKTDNSGIVTYLVRVLINNDKKIAVREGMTSTVNFVLAEAKDVLTVPVAAVSNINGSPSVVLENGETKVVTTGFTDGKNVEVISGLSEGDKVVYYQ